MKDTIFYGIGGGNNEDERMLQHFERIADITRDNADSDHPVLTLLPTAHHNGLHPKLPHRDYIKNLFRDRLGCRVTEILLGDVAKNEDSTPIDEVKDILASSHGLYVLNGDTRHLMQQVTHNKLLEVFRNAFRNGLPFTGSSAGCIWVGETCMSDSMAYDHPEDWEYILVEGLGLFPGLAINAHADQGIRSGEKTRTPRSQLFDDMYESQVSIIQRIAIPEYVAIEIRNRTLEAIFPEQEASRIRPQSIDPYSQNT